GRRTPRSPRPISSSRSASARRCSPSSRPRRTRRPSNAMSLLQELGAQLRATSDELPTGLVTVAMERLRSATELLNWVRQSSVDPIGVPQLGNATEHAEHAAAALRLAQDAIAAYLAAIGLSGEPSAPPDQDWREGLKPSTEV